MSNRKKRSNPKRIIGLVVLVALMAGAAVLGVRVARLVDLTAIEIQTTPTPEPVAGNVMMVTIDPNAPTPEPVLRTGSQGSEVKELQARLQTLGYYSGEVDGQFGSGTQAAVTLFQEQNGLGADGIAGPETRTLLYSAGAKPMTVTPSPAPTDTPAPQATSAAVPGETADGMPLLVNKTHPLPDGYETVHLVNMTDYCDSSIVKIKAKGIEGEQVAVDALMVMLRAAHEDGITVWQVSAGYRSVSYQQQLFDEKVASFVSGGMSREKAKSAASKTVADPGTSEHHTGLAFDITVPGVSFKGTDQAAWVAEHCWDYGFILRYQEEKESITGFVAEPWHFRYVGAEHSLTMRDKNLCLEEYVEQYGNE